MPGNGHIFLSAWSLLMGFDLMQLEISLIDFFFLVVAMVTVNASHSSDSIVLYLKRWLVSRHFVLFSVLLPLQPHHYCLGSRGYSLHYIAYRNRSCSYLGYSSEPIIHSCLSSRIGQGLYPPVLFPQLKWIFPNALSTTVFLFIYLNNLFL